MAAAVLMPATVAARGLLPTIAMARPIRVHDKIELADHDGGEKDHRLDRDARDLRPLKICKPSPPG